MPPSAGLWRRDRHQPSYGKRDPSHLTGRGQKPQLEWLTERHEFRYREVSSGPAAPVIRALGHCKRWSRTHSPVTAL